MREASFVQRNKEKWAEVESNLKNRLAIPPDELASSYVELTNDLAYAQTFYPESKTRAYLNELSIYAHQSIYRDRKSTHNQFVDFFKKEVPYSVYQIRRPLFYSLLITILAVLIGWTSAHYDTGFVRLILGDQYVDQTIGYIKEGNPAAIYNSGGELGSFLAITINNVRVAFFAFALGIFFSVGTGYILFSNGIMLGAFHYLFYKYGVLGTAMSAIWIHGAFEVSVIIIAGGCGIALGNSFMFPGSFRRIDSFRLMVRRAGTILVSTIPFFITAGFLEGFVTRHYLFSIGLSLVIIFICLSIILFYFIIYPFQLNKKYQWSN